MSDKFFFKLAGIFVFCDAISADLSFDKEHVFDARGIIFHDTVELLIVVWKDGATLPIHFFRNSLMQFAVTITAL